MAPSQSADSILNYIFLLFGIALISVLLQSLVRFEAIRVQTVWAVSVHLSDHDEEHVARVANEIWGTGADEAAGAKRLPTKYSAITARRPPEHAVSSAAARISGN